MPVGFTWADVTFNQPSDVAAINALGNAVESLLSDPWTDYSASFQITAATTNPTKGNSTYQARYMRIGKTVVYTFYIVIGSTFTPGSGEWFFPLPVPAISGIFPAGAVMIFDSGTAFRTATLAGINTSQAQMYLNGAAGGLSSAGSGTAWAAGDYIKASLTYEAA